MRTIVVNIRTTKCDVYIGRGSKWGNPFAHTQSQHPVTRVASRDEAIRCYSEWIRKQPQLMAALPELIGKVLGCYCKPAACHGDVLAALANELAEDAEPEA